MQRSFFYSYQDNIRNFIVFINMCIYVVNILYIYIVLNIYIYKYKCMNIYNRNTHVLKIIWIKIRIFLSYVK